MTLAVMVNNVLPPSSVVNNSSLLQRIDCSKVTDTDTLGTFANASVRTPNLDALMIDDEISLLREQRPTESGRARARNMTAAMMVRMQRERG